MESFLLSDNMGRTLNHPLYCLEPMDIMRYHSHYYVTLYGQREITMGGPDIIRWDHKVSLFSGWSQKRKSETCAPASLKKANIHMWTANVGHVGGLSELKAVPGQKLAVLSPIVTRKYILPTSSELARISWAPDENCSLGWHVNFSLVRLSAENLATACPSCWPGGVLSC